MIQALDRNYDYLMGAYLIKRGDVLQPSSMPRPSDGIFFRCRLASEISDQDEYGAKNLLSYGNRLSIETLHNFRLSGKDLTPNHDDFVFVEDKWYVIDKVQTYEYEKREKTLGLARMKYGNIKIRISLVEISVEQ